MLNNGPRKADTWLARAVALVANSNGPVSRRVMWPEQVAMDLISYIVTFIAAADWTQ